MTLCRRRKPPTRWLKTLRRSFRQPPLIRGLKDCTAGAWPMPISVIPRTLGSVQRPALARHRIEGKEQPDWLMPSSGSPDACRLPRSQHQDFPYVARTRISVLLTVAPCHRVQPACLPAASTARLTDQQSWLYQGMAGSTVERHSPKPIRAAPGFSHHARRITVSPSSRKRSRLAVRQLNRLLAAHGEFEQASRPPRASDRTPCRCPADPPA